MPCFSVSMSQARSTQVLNQLLIKYAILSLPPFIGNTIRKVWNWVVVVVHSFISALGRERQADLVSLRPAWSTSSGTELLQRNSISKNQKQQINKWGGREDKEYRITFKDTANWIKKLKRIKKKKKQAWTRKIGLILKNNIQNRI